MIRPKILYIFVIAIFLLGNGRSILGSEPSLHIFGLSRATLVDGGPTTLTPFVSGLPGASPQAFIFLDQQGTQQVKKILEKDAWKDLIIVDTLSPHLFLDLGDYPYHLIDFNGSAEKTIEIDDSAIYEVWISYLPLWSTRNVRGRKSALPLDLVLEIDGSQFSNFSKKPAIENETYKRWRKYGELRLDKGTHEVIVKDGSPGVVNHVEILLVPKARYERQVENLTEYSRKRGIDLSYFLSESGDFYLSRPETLDLKMELTPQGDAMEIKDYILEERWEEPRLAREIELEDLGIDLLRYPVLGIVAEKDGFSNGRLGLKLGMDYTGNNQIDEVLEIFLKDEISLTPIRQSLRLDRVIGDRVGFKRYYNLVSLQFIPDFPQACYLEQLDICSPEAVRILGEEVNFNQKRFTVRSRRLEYRYSIRNDKSLEVIVSPPQAVRIEEESFVKVILPLEEAQEYPFVSFRYRIEDPTTQLIDVFWGLDENGDGRLDREVAAEETVRSYLDGGEYYREVTVGGIGEAVPINLCLYLKPVEEVVTKRKKYSFIIKDIKFFEKELADLAVILGREDLRKQFLFKVGRKHFSLNQLSRFWIEAEKCLVGEYQDLSLPAGENNLEVLARDPFCLRWVILSPSGRKKRKNERVEVNYRRINPTRYLITATADGPFWLVFSESYHPQWRAYLRQNAPMKGRERFALLSWLRDRGRKEIGEHYIVNGYANCWYIDPSRTGGQTPGSKSAQMEIIIEFLPQRALELGILLSGFFLFLLLGGLFLSKKKSRG
jgi:hypothetical protein